MLPRRPSAPCAWSTRSGFSELTGFDRKTLDDWISKGCPVAGEGKGGEILVDVRAVWKWREEQVATKALKDAMGGAGDENMTDDEIEAAQAAPAQDDMADLGDRDLRKDRGPEG